MSKRVILLTGAAGFVGSHMVEHFLKNTDDKVIGVDCLNYSGTWDRLRDVKLEEDKSAFDSPRFTPVVWDFRREAEPNLVKELQKVTHVIHAGALSHVDQSIKDPMSFIECNVMGTGNVLNLARKLNNLETFFYFNTDECFGPAPMGVDFPGFKENDQHNPKNPYAASKSAGSQVVTSYANTYSLPCVQTYTMNIFGERQHAEKFIPLVIRSVLKGEIIPIHATPDKKQAGIRSYLHARNLSAAYLWLLDEKPWLKYPVTEVQAYNIVGEQQVDNLTLAGFIADSVSKHLGQKHELFYDMVDFHSSRPGHDLKYALTGLKLRGLGFFYPKTFHQSLHKTVGWYLQEENRRWLSP